MILINITPKKNEAHEIFLSSATGAFSLTMHLGNYLWYFHAILEVLLNYNLDY